MEPSIEDKNIALAEFEGCKVTDRYVILPNGEYVSPAILDYHRNWNSLHRVAKKVAAIFDADEDNQKILGYRPLIYINLFTPIEEVHEALYTFTQFIKTQQQ